MNSLRDFSEFSMSFLKKFRGERLQRDVRHHEARFLGLYALPFDCDTRKNHGRNTSHSSSKSLSLREEIRTFVTKIGEVVFVAKI
jgi:hypothetical protein